jgi:hypothetical protein
MMGVFARENVKANCERGVSTLATRAEMNFKINHEGHKGHEGKSHEGKSRESS